MKIAFHAPLKSPEHPVPSGDRLMARLLIEALRLGGHDVDLASQFRSFSPLPETLADLRQQASQEIERIDAQWRAAGPPDCWFCYHPYYKSPDLIGPALCRLHGVAYVTAEASYSRRRNEQGWSAHQALLGEALEQALVNISLTRRDLEGIRQSVPGAVLEHLPPFIDVAAMSDIEVVPQPFRLATVAMMRKGDKFSSYAMLALALQQLIDLPWTLSVIGDGPCRADVEALFAGLPPGRIIWRGQLVPEDIAEELSKASLYIWPGHGEAYGLAYLEAQAAGLPVVAERIAGVPEVVLDGRSGLLTQPADVAAYAAAIRALLTDEERRLAMADTARQFVLGERSLTVAAQRLDQILQTYFGKQP